VIHKYLLHRRPINFFGRRVEPRGSVQHRNHHLAASDLNRVLLKPLEVVSFVVQIAIVMGRTSGVLTARQRLAEVVDQGHQGAR
jgi:hypothetical protein